jgi:hypothetical protein
VGEIGTAGRNALVGPDFKNVDIGLAKSFKIRHGHSLIVRAEVFNVFNWTNFALPDANLASGSFGRITSVVTGSGAPRVIQLGIRYVF